MRLLVLVPCGQKGSGLNFKSCISQVFSVQFSCSVVSDTWCPHGLQSTKPPCPSSTPRVCPSSYPLNQLCYPTIQCVPYWIRCSLNSVTDVLIRGEEHRDSERGWPCEDGGRDWMDVATSQGTSRVTSWKKRRKGFLSRAFRGHTPADTLI